jgi:hypothetical protein
MNYDLSTTWTVILAVLAAWELFWKGIALWKASRHNQRGWFIALLVINSAGILPILYLLMYRRQTVNHKEERHETSLSF